MIAPAGRLIPNDITLNYLKYLTSPTNREVDSVSRVPATRRVRTSPSSRDSGAHAMANQSLIEEEFDTVVRGKLFEPEEPLLVTPGPVAATNADPIMCAMNCGREVWGDQTGLSKFCSKSCRKMFLELNYESAALSTALSSRDPPSPKVPHPCAMGCGGVYLVTGAFSPCCSRACSNAYDGTKQTRKDTSPTAPEEPPTEPLTVPGKLSLVGMPSRKDDTLSDASVRAGPEEHVMPGGAIKQNRDDIAEVKELTGIALSQTDRLAAFWLWGDPGISTASPLATDPLFMAREFANTNKDAWGDNEIQSHGQRTYAVSMSMIHALVTFKLAFGQDNTREELGFNLDQFHDLTLAARLSLSPVKKLTTKERRTSLIPAVDPQGTQIANFLLCLGKALALVTEYTDGSHNGAQIVEYIRVKISDGYTLSFLMEILNKLVRGGPKAMAATTSLRKESGGRVIFTTAEASARPVRFRDGSEDSR